MDFWKSDHANHDILMNKIAKRLAYKGVIKLICQYLISSIMSIRTALERSKNG